MKQQVVFIHWWESKENYKDFNEYLEKLKYKPFEEKKKKWKNTLSDDLGTNFELFDPLMPNKDFADYKEWKIMFEKIFPYINNNIILIWHSLWWTFLVKYLNENDFPVKIKKILIIAWAFRDDDKEILWNFNFDKNLINFKKYEDLINFYHSTDDLIVSINDVEDFRKLLPNSEYKIYNNKFHFIDENFPELIEDIKNIK